jgi:Coenzyme PQQ synthesis protein D (PqqD)
MAITFTTDVTLSDSGFLFDHSSGQTFTLNDTGQFIFKKLQAGEEDHSILSLMMEEFDVSEGVARKDLDDFHRQLRESGIVE